MPRLGFVTRDPHRPVQPPRRNRPTLHLTKRQSADPLDKGANREESTEQGCENRVPTGSNRATQHLRDPFQVGDSAEHGRLNQQDQERDTEHSNQSALQGAALRTYCKSLPGCTEPTHNPEPRRGRDTEFARNERDVRGHVGVTESITVITRRGRGNAVAL